MANQKISELPSYAAMLAADLIPVVDAVSGATKQITYQNFTTRAHGTFSDSNTKTVPATNAEYAVTYNSNDSLVNLTHAVGDSKIYVPAAGAYVVLMSAVIAISQAPAALFDLWVKVNGQNLDKSNTQVKINSAAVAQVLSVGFVLDLGANDYFEFFYHAGSVYAEILAVAAQTGPPVIPACPSVIVAVNKVSS
jgi:hypothetical protein